MVCVVSPSCDVDGVLTVVVVQNSPLVGITVAQSAGIKIITDGAVVFTNVGRRRLQEVTGKKQKNRVMLQENTANTTATTGTKV